MEKHYFYIPKLKPRNKSFKMDGEEFYHLSKVLRLNGGEIIYLLNGRGWIFKGKILNKTKKAAEVEIIKASKVQKPKKRIKTYFLSRTANLERKFLWKKKETN